MELAKYWIKIIVGIKNKYKPVSRIPSIGK
jgi:hypothetical protein